MSSDDLEGISRPSLPMDKPDNPVESFFSYFKKLSIEVRWTIFGLLVVSFVWLSVCAGVWLLGFDVNYWWFDDYYRAVNASQSVVLN